MEPNARKILVINGKGGCGKTTVATNLAVTYANKGHCVALTDNDPQASSTFWAEQRDPELPQVHVVRAHQRSNFYQTQAFHNRLPSDISRIIVDGSSNTRDRDLELILKNADIILIPLLPSAVDIRAAGQFITQLLAHRAFRVAPRPVGVISNRVQSNTETHAKLLDFLGCLEVPNVATFRDSPAYTQAFESGRGVVDMTESRSARREYAAWNQLTNWIEAQPRHVRTTVAELRQRPLAATRHDENAQNADDLSARRRPRS